ncbi:MAG: hypothetical protein IK043_01025 [Candidatus Methanomethylophilaceae archaeon]|nr:hypothetical protein [Candidatus Methanomethylophilaceae archaeon]
MKLESSESFSISPFRSFLLTNTPGEDLISLSPSSFFISAFLISDAVDLSSGFIYLISAPENPCYILGDDRDPTEEEEAILSEYDFDRISLGPVSLHANHCMIIVHNEMDRRAAE